MEATCDVIDPGLLQLVTSELIIQVTNFDGTNIINRKVKKALQELPYNCLAVFINRVIGGQ